MPDCLALTSNAVHIMFEAEALLFSKFADAICDKFTELSFISRVSVETH